MHHFVEKLKNTLAIIGTCYLVDKQVFCLILPFGLKGSHQRGAMKGECLIKPLL